MGRIDLESADDARNAGAILYKREILAELDALETLFGFEDFGRLARERSSHSQDAIAMWNFFFRIASIERLHPEERGRLVVHPAELAGTGLDAAERDTLVKRKAGDFIYDSAGMIP